MTETPEYKCRKCGIAMNSEGRVFTVCSECWDKSKRKAEQLTPESDIDFKKHLYLLCGCSELKADVLKRKDDNLDYNILMQAVESINTSSGKYWIEMSDKSFGIADRDFDDGEWVKAFNWSDYATANDNGMQGSLTAAVYFIYLEGKK